MKLLFLNHPLIERAFDGWRNCLGQDYEGYRNHAYRVFNLTVWISSASGEEIEEIALAAAFHDIGIWLAQTFDYLEPSINALRYCLEESGRLRQLPLIEAMVLQHHKITPWHGPGRHLVEAFRRADWLDVCLFALPTRVPRGFFAQLLTAFPRAGFHWRLAALSATWISRHPLRPLPMFRL